MVRSQAPLPGGITRSISHGRFAEAADALRTLAQREPSVGRRDDWSDVVQAFTGEGKRDRLCRPSADTGSARAVAALLPAIDDLAPLVSTGYLGANPESGFFSALLLQIATELRQSMSELLGEQHLNY